MLRTLVSWLVVGVITLALLEGGLRVGFVRQFGDLGHTILLSEERFTQADPATGWSLRPGASGPFTNGLYEGHAHIDSRGIRQNAAASTFLSGQPTVFLIGDSNVAGFEVDDDRTMAALLEQRVRARGQSLNVVNLGVRGYGTDQAVLRAQQYRDLQPRTVLYLFTNNDPFDTNRLHLPGRELGKGTFVRQPGQHTFQPYKYPVPQYALEDAGVVLFDRQCEPVVHERRLGGAADESRSLLETLKQYLWTLRAISFVRHGVQPAPDLSDDPMALLEDGQRDFHPDLFTAYHEHGVVRTRCAEYFEAQMRDLLTRLRQMPSVERVLVAHFPDNEMFGRFATGEPVPSVEMFKHLLADGTIDGYLNLGQRFVEQKLDYPTLACPGDGHLCGDGIAWEASELDTAFSRAF